MTADPASLKHSNAWHISLGEPRGPLGTTCHFHPHIRTYIPPFPELLAMIFTKLLILVVSVMVARREKSAWLRLYAMVELVAQLTVPNPGQNALLESIDDL